MFDTGWSKENPVGDLARALTGAARKTAARLVHEWLLSVRGEPDEPDIGPALVLADIYDCHACVDHIGQVYVKGIMDARGVSMSAGLWMHMRLRRLPPARRTRQGEESEG